MHVISKPSPFFERAKWKFPQIGLKRETNFSKNHQAKPKEEVRENTKVVGRIGFLQFNLLTISSHCKWHCF